MLPGIQAGGGEFLGPDLIREIAEQGFRVVRIQAFANDPPHFTLTSPTKTAEMVQEVIDGGLRPYTMIRRAHQLEDIPDGTDVEFANEPDLEGRFGWPSHRGFLDELRRTIDLWQGRWALWTPAVSNLNKRGMKFLKSIDWVSIPADIGCSHHWYPNPKSPHESHINRTRDDDIRELRAIVGSSRKLLLSEIGFNHVEWTEEQVAEHMRIERAFWERHNYEAAIAYQLIDAREHTIEGRYGFRRYRTDGSSPLGDWKPVTEAWVGNGQG